MGNGTRVKFWHGLWCGNCPLKESFLELYDISCDRESSLADLMQFSNERIHWDVQFSQSVQYWEMGPLAVFMDLNHSTL